VEKLSSPPARTLYDERGQPVPARTLAALQRELALDAIPASRPLRYGLVVHRAALRAFPTSLRVFSSPGDTDIDRFQESALFPGDAVAVLHESRGRQWLFVASERYSAWIEARHVAIGTREEVLGYASRTPYIVVTGATVRTTYTPEEPRVSALRLDVGLRLPLRTGLDPSRTVNGQHPYASHVVDLPARRADGSLEFVPALVPRSADVAADYLPLTPANLIAQAFKFLGERYGWGHSYDARDCSGFVSEVYRSFGILMPRNTRDQAVSPALDRIGFEPGDDPARRQAAVRGLQVGDLVYIPGHVMMAIGHRDGMAYVIHDTNGGGWRGPDGGRVSAGLNGVSLTPLDPPLFNDEQTYVDRITSIQRVRPRPSRRESPSQAHRHRPAHPARAAEAPVQDRAAHGRHGRGHRGAGAHRHRPYRPRRGAGHRGDHRRHPRLDRRGDRALHQAAPDRPGDRQPQPHLRPDPGRAGAQHQRQGGGGDRGLRPVGAAVRRAAVQDARRRRPGDHHRHHHFGGPHRQDGGRLDLGGGARLRLAKDQGGQGHRPGHRAGQGDPRRGRRPRPAAPGRQPGLDPEAGGLRHARAGGRRRAAGAAGAAGQGRRHRGPEVRHRARAHPGDGRRERVRPGPGVRPDPAPRRGHHQHQADEDRRPVQ